MLLLLLLLLLLLSIRRHATKTCMTLFDSGVYQYQSNMLPALRISGGGHAVNRRKRASAMPN